jgi:integrase
MPRRKVLTEAQVLKLPRRAKRYHMADPIQQGLILRVPPQGPVGFSAVAWRNGKQTWQSVGTTATVSLTEARALARDVCHKIQTGLPRMAAPLHSVGVIVDQWFKLKVEGDGYRTASERRRIIERYIKPHIGGRVFTDLRRSDVAELLDLLAERHGKAQADQALKVLSAVCRWYEKRSDDYRSPIVAGMRRSKAGSRERVLNDEEIRIVWQLADRSGALGAFVKLALLTGQRRAKLLALRFDDIDANGVWHITRQDREKGNGGDLRLPPLALEIIYSQPRLVSDSRVFRRPNDRTFSNFQRAAKLPHWTTHDLRRTARSLLSRAGVQTEISELVLGHSIKGIQRVYDRHDYFDEKGEALAKLATLIERILNPTENVVALGAAL